MRVLAGGVVVASLLPLVRSWKQWMWKGAGPGPRRGHSLALHGSRAIVFGGRADDTRATHVPKSYDTVETQGRLEFSTYTDHPVQDTCTDDTCTVPIGVYYNDVWAYDINCTRFADDSCVDKSWVQLHQGLPWGGCNMRYGALVCPKPPERWFHRAEVFQDSMLVYGGFGILCTDYCDDMWRFNFQDNSWTEMHELGNPLGPGKRWKFSSSATASSMYFFGGYRLWHGFAPQNSEANVWSDLTVYPRGGYLDDLWQFDVANGTWTERHPKPTCDATDTCSIEWPSGRAGHASVILGDGLYIYGGYQTFFPYPATDGRGGGRGVLEGTSPGYTPFPTNPYYLSDLWVFNLTTGTWREVAPRFGTMPGPRAEHSLVAAGQVFVLFGGYRSNYYYEDTWQFNTTASQWLQQEAFIHALYPPQCTDDLALRADLFSGTYQPYVAVNDTTKSTEELEKEAHYGTTHFSVVAVPTRGVLDVADTFYTQARRKAPGWDGCRDRIDNRTDLPWILQWSRPAQRAGHMAVYHSGYQLMLMYGGYGVTREELYASSSTTPAFTYDDWWSYSLANCIKNCSLHGVCSYGRCMCDEGYYGVDCSNMTCPGSVCAFNDITKGTSCVHCCFSGFEHTNNDTYVPNIQKSPCSTTNTHYSNGVCDGFGQCICRPPFIGADCSIRNCAYNCSGHGFCSVEFPNSRCLCDPGWAGKYCDQRVCLNNCSYPNGICVNGSCYCSMLYDPYNSTLSHFPFLGQDCSFMLPFASANRLSVGLVILLALVVQAVAYSS
ncbi:hypothetical protein H257_16643 [Aphanomyces astaci]|uniref:EGF-like domain-containing protein n=1 Tax=Aphanomyces astaci TaxID=112090 RepID=W4FI07_APHAT|nr:hypothetical protein H257_16643 [Aphanomyces astaci]ETV67095.1 hypothetical protein H257_16643 [Aphanomyces astaci]|eukprot:XP_009843464.1 hypothetical protein H257_16643 [Aphanomyces astaci]